MEIGVGSKRFEDEYGEKRR